MKALGIFIVVAVLFAAGLVRWSLGAQLSAATTQDPFTVKAVEAEMPKETTSTPIPTPTVAPKVLPAKAQLDVAFTSQAPLSVWDALHEDACEEASLLTVKYFLHGPLPSKQDVDAEIIDTVNWETSHGYDKSITLAQLNTIANQKFGLTNGHVFTNISLADIKAEVAAGHPVILGMAGKLLANPNFKNGGPNYHMLVVTGYDETGFITDDPGTRLGEKFHYDYAGFDTAIHDWDATNILNGGHNMLVFK
jgi:hypothetical protein